MVWGSGMSDEHLPDLPPEAAIQLGEIDLAIEDVLRSLDEHLVELGLDDVDRSIIIHHVRWAYIQGWTDRHNEIIGTQGLTPDDL